MSEAYQGASPNARLLVGALPTQPTGKARLGNAFSVSLVTHVAIALIILFVVTLPALPTPDSPGFLPRDIIWTVSPGPGGGGGGGGNKTPEPPKKAEAPDKMKQTVPVAKQPKMDVPEPPKPVQQLNIEAKPVAAGVEQLPGAVSAMVTPTLSMGSGTGGGAGTGRGTGSGSGDGSGLGPGYGGGFGGGAYRPGNGVTGPTVLQMVKPNYTADAMRAKIQGIVMLEAVVNEDGSVGAVRVTRSLDPTFGLDKEAEKTVKKWIFRPGTRFGQPVPVLVEIELSFTLR
jgi:periplasmic protein TonB